MDKPVADRGALPAIPLLDKSLNGKRHFGSYHHIRHVACSQSHARDLAGIKHVFHSHKTIRVPAKLRTCLHIWLTAIDPKTTRNGHDVLVIRSILAGAR